DAEDSDAEKIAAAYESDYATYPGFCIAKDVPVAGQQDFQLMDVQNRLFRELTGIEDPYAVSYQPEISMIRDVQINENGQYQHVETDPIIDDSIVLHPTVSYKLKTEKDGIWYCSLNNNLQKTLDEQKPLSLARLTSLVEDEERAMYNFGTDFQVQQFVQSIGYVEAGQTIEVKVGFLSETEVDYRITLYQIDEDVFKRGYEILTRNPFTVTEFADSRLTGTVHADEDSLLYLSIPYDKGWKAEVDGAPAEIQPVLDAMTGIPLKAGDHTVKLRFIPRGLIAGVIVSTGALAGYIWLIVMQNRRRKGEKVKETAHADA
ncbi:MAG TPA: hypothetical protein DCG49_06070, partial [Ruminococcus sp.]|nr:hypothetical protein [Ruminococcus sp.]